MYAPWLIKEIAEKKKSKKKMYIMCKQREALKRKTNGRNPPKSLWLIDGSVSSER